MFAALDPYKNGYYDKHLLSTSGSAIFNPLNPIGLYTVRFGKVHKLYSPGAKFQRAKEYYEKENEKLFTLFIFNRLSLLFLSQGFTSCALRPSSGGYRSVQPTGNSELKSLFNLQG